MALTPPFRLVQQSCILQNFQHVLFPNFEAYSRIVMKRYQQPQTEILLSINDALSGIRSREDLLRLIGNHLKHTVPFTTSCILRYNKNTRTYSSYIAQAETGHFADADVETQLVISQIVENDSNRKNNLPVVWNVAALIHAGNVQLNRIQEAGIKEMVTLTLVDRNESIGLLVLLSENHLSFTKESLEKIKSICSPISIAMAKMIANEEIIKLEEEKKLLLSLSNEIAALRNREDFFKVVSSKLKLVFNLSEFGIAQIDESGETYSAFALDFEQKTKSVPDFEKVTSARYSVTDPIFSRVINSLEPVLFVVDEVFGQPGMPDYVEFWKKAGFRYFLTVPLRVGGSNIGFVNFHVENSHSINQNSLLLQGVCDQLAVAVSNIIASEKIQSREEEKNLLLSLSNEIAALKSRDDLFKVVNGKIKQLFGIKELGFSKIDENGETYSIFLVDVLDRVKMHPEFESILNAHFSVKDPLFAAVINLEEPMVYEVDEIRKLPDMPPYVAFWEKTGIEKVATFPLKAGGIAIGTALLIIEKEVEFNVSSTLLKGVCAQLAVTISNILSNEKIKAREEEKSMLLEFSNAIASVQNKYLFAKILKHQLSKLFSIEDYVINILSEDEKHIIGFLYDLENEEFKKKEFLKLLETPIAVDDGIFNRILASDDPVTFWIEDWIRMEQPPVYLEAAIATGLQYMTGVRMRIGAKNIATISIKHDKAGLPVSSLPFLKSICSQISIAVSNLIAHEKISQQLVEIENYKQQLEEEKIYLREEIEINQNYSEIIGESAAIKKVFHLVTQVARTDSTVLILGETGTGKELIARAIHHASPRKDKLMIKINCAALPANLIESELFGHERGSFTGAVERRVGKFELANRGTLFLDEIGEMPLELQVKLLRALQEKEIERIGGKSVIKTDVRIIAATNRDLEKLMEEGKFRTDLYYRLNIFPIQLPPLRDRREDIPKLASHFILRYSKKSGKIINTLSNSALQLLKTYDWPGNIRELEHLIERSVVLTDGDTIKDIHLPIQKAKTTQKNEPEEFTVKSIFEHEKEYILKVLKHVNGRIAGEGGAAAMLGIPTSTLNSRMKKLGIRREHRGD